MKNTLRLIAKRILPRPLYGTILRNIKYLLPDIVKKVSGKNDELIPPGRMIFTGSNSENFKEGGEEYFEFFKLYGSIKPVEHILDIGSGIGRMALPLTGFLSAKGAYDGFDIVPMGVKWCQENITARFPNFKFQVADIYNKEYNSSGRLKARDFRFPYPDGTFDFVFATSVFTHMFLEDIEHYLAEASRVMKRGGRCILTFFLMNPEAAALIAAKKSSIDFKHKLGEIYVVDKLIPEEAVCVPEEIIRALFTKHGLEIVEPIRFGAWCRREKFVSGQDFVVARKP